MKLCKHADHTVIDWIKAPKYSTKEILIDKEVVDNGKEHLIVRFADKSPKEKYGWFVMSREEVRRCKTQRNGRIMVYVVPLSKKKTFIEDKKCTCDNLTLPFK